MVERNANLIWQYEVCNFGVSPFFLKMTKQQLTGQVLNENVLILLLFGHVECLECLIERPGLAEAKKWLELCCTRAYAAFLNKWSRIFTSSPDHKFRVRWTCLCFFCFSLHIWPYHTARLSAQYGHWSSTAGKHSLHCMKIPELKSCYIYMSQY